MPTISLTVPVEAVPAIKSTFGGATDAETVALVKAFLRRKLIEEVKAAQQYTASEAAKETVTEIVVT